MALGIPLTKQDWQRHLNTNQIKDTEMRTFILTIAALLISTIGFAQDVYQLAGGVNKSFSGADTTVFYKVNNQGTALAAYMLIQNGDTVLLRQNGDTLSLAHPDTSVDFFLLTEGDILNRGDYKYWDGDSWELFTGGTLDAAYDSGGAGAGRTITADAGAVEILGYGAQQLLNIKDTADGYSSAWLQMYGSGAIRTGGYLDLTGFGLDDGTAYPYEAMPAGSHISGINNKITDNTGSPLNAGSSASGISNTISNSNASFITGVGNTIDGAGTGNSAIIGGAYNTITANDQNIATMAIIGSIECYADSALSFIASSFQSGARGDHATVIAGYRAYANYYHQFMMGSQPIVDTTGFLFHTSSNWQLNNKTFTIGNGGVDDPTPITMTNSLTQIANGNMLLGTHWKDVYDDLDTNSAILTVLGDSVGNADGLIFEVLKQDLDTVFRVSESGLRIKDGTQGDGKVLTSDATGNATWQDAATLDFSAVPSYADNTAAEAVLGAGKLYYTDVAGEYMLKVTH